MDYAQDAVERWARIAERQRTKDRLFLNRLAPYFLPGTILEIGAGCGQLSEILLERGYDVLASDLSRPFVDYMISRGIPAMRVDALDIRRTINEPVNNIIGQGVSTLNTSDLGVVDRTYRSCYDALSTGGRFLWIFPNTYGSRGSSSVRQHRRIINAIGFRVVAEFRDQIMPSRFYNSLPSSVINALEWSAGRQLGIRTIFILEKPVG